MKATRLMRKAFFAVGAKVTAENIEQLAEWCGGVVIDDDPAHPYIRVPVIRATSRKQTEARIGLWVTMTEHLGEPSFKVYRPEWLEREFDIIDERLPDDNIPDIEWNDAGDEYIIIEDDRPATPLPVRHPGRVTPNNFRPARLVAAG